MIQPPELLFPGDFCPKTNRCLRGPSLPLSGRQRRTPQPRLSVGITERSRIAVKGLTAPHDDAVDKMPIAGKPEIVADAA